MAESLWTPYLYTYNCVYPKLLPLSWKHAVV